MKELEPIDVLDLFPEEREALLALLGGLSDAEWSRETICPGWTVKDIAAHLLGDDIGMLSRGRDGFSYFSPQERGLDLAVWEDLLVFINRRNETWVEAARRLSPRLLVELLRWSGAATYPYFQSVDLQALGGPVSWAGPEPAPAWFHLAREFTERWLHHQQIRDALERPTLDHPRYFTPVLDCFVRALPRTFRGVDAPPGTQVRLVIPGEAGGVWDLVRAAQGWRLGKPDGGVPASVVTIKPDLAWRLFTRGVSAELAQAWVQIEGDAVLGRQVLETVSILA